MKITLQNNSEDLESFKFAHINNELTKLELKFKNSDIRDSIHNFIAQNPNDVDIEVFGKGTNVSHTFKKAATNYCFCEADSAIGADTSVLVLLIDDIDTEACELKKGKASDK